MKMNNTAIITLVALIAAAIIRAEDPSNARPTAALTELVSGSHWAWYEGNFDRYKKRMPYWIEFYNDGTARVPWRDLPQYWTITEPNVLTVSGAGTNPDKHIFIMNLANKTGSRADQSLHIRYEKSASKPARWK